MFDGVIRDGSQPGFDFERQRCLAMNSYGGLGPSCIMFRRVDCLRIHVPDLDAALRFYRDKLGLKPVWKRGSLEAGLKMRDSETELVLVTEDLKGTEVDVLVDSADKVAMEFERLGGKIAIPPFDITIGRCAMVQDPWENRFVILDISKGTIRTDKNGNVV